MFKIIRNATVYNPDKLGKKDVLIVNDKIIAIDDKIEISSNGIFDVEEINCEGKILVPGFIDGHVHILGGGGEGGFSNRTPEATLSILTKAGVTTVVGVLGTDGVGRDMNALLSKARALEEEGITTFVFDGNYRLPIKTLTENLINDIMAIDKIIGIGEIALSDHRSSQPSFDEFVKTVADTRVGGILSGKAGIINVHLGDGKRCLDLINEVVEKTEIPISQFWPTHINRNAYLFEEGIKFAKKGGIIDFTGNSDPDLWEKLYGEVKVSKAIKRVLEEGISEDNFTLTSDGQGSFPMFDNKGNYKGIGIGTSSCLLESIKACVFEENIPLEKAIRAITVNPANILKLKNKGKIEKNYDADLCLLDEKTLDIDMVIAKGKIMVKGGNPTVFGVFEKASKN